MLDPIPHQLGSSEGPETAKFPNEIAVRGMAPDMHLHETIMLRRSSLTVGLFAVGTVFLATTLLACSSDEKAKCTSGSCLDTDEDEATSGKSKKARSRDDDDDDTLSSSQNLPDDSTPKTDDEPTDDEPTDDKSTTNDPPDPAKACNDMADVVAAAAARCGGDRKTERAGFIDAAAAGDCSNIKSLRDGKELYDTCLPWMQMASCTDLVNGAYPAECIKQLLP